MRILIFTTAYFPMVGGAEVAIKEVTDRLTDIEFHLFCAKMRRETAKKERVGNVMVHRVGFGYSWDKFLFPLLAPIIAWRCSKDEGTIIWSVMASYGGFAALFLSWLRPKLKFVLTLQEGDPVERYEKNAGLFNGLRKKIFAQADRVHAISRFLGKWGKNMGVKSEPVIIPNGVDIVLFTKHISEDERSRIRERFHCQSNDIVLVTASRLSQKNAIDDVVRAMGGLPEKYKFLVLGSGEDEGMLKKLSEEEGVSSRIHFFGSVPHKDLPSFLQASNIFIRPSRSEGLGNAFLEAMACGIPVIGTMVGGIPDFLLDGETGLGCEVDSPESIARAVRKLEEDAVLRARIIEQASALVKQKYDWERIAKRMCEEIFV